MMDNTSVKVKSVFVAEKGVVNVRSENAVMVITLQFVSIEFRGET
jgi:hypothetical protein